jgi:hypothetical protein
VSLHSNHLLLVVHVGCVVGDKCLPCDHGLVVVVVVVVVVMVAIMPLEPR